MQNFPNSAAPPPPGFPSRGGNMVGSPYQPHISDPQISPRTIEDYAAMQHHQPLLQSHNQHLHLRAQQHTGQASHIHGYGPRRGAGEIPQASALAGSGSNSYRKEAMDYYFSLSGRDRSRRGGGGGYGAGFGYPNLDGHLPHQYRHVPGSVPSSSIMSAYPMDYSTNAGGSANSGGGSFSPSQQFTMAQNASVQPVSGAEMHQRQHSQKYLSHQGLNQGHRVFSMSGHRIPSQFGQYPPLSAPTASAGMYNSSPQRYETSSGGGVDLKITNSPTHSNPNAMSGSSASNSSGHQESVGQGYPSSNHSPYSPQSHPLSKHTSRRTPQHNLGAAYDASLKMQHPSPGHVQPKNNQSSVSLSPAAPHHTQDISKSPMHSQNQQTNMNQNFSPISNPSPAPSAVHSPSCSSSSSPMGVSESLGNSSSLHSSIINPRSAHGHARPQHSVAQLSPTPSSNSSISSCGSIGRIASRAGRRDDTPSSLYPQVKLSQDAGLNSLNALTSQVANLPNTVQHMMLTDTVLSQRKGRESVHQPHIQQTVTNQQTPQNAIAAVQALSNEGSDVLGSEPEEENRNQIEQAEPDKVRQKSGSSIESNQDNYYPASQSQTKSRNCPELHPQLDSRSTETPGKQTNNHVAKPFSQTKEQESRSSSPSAVPPYEEPLQLSCPPALSAASSPARSTQSNCVIEPNLSHCDDKTGLKEKTSSAVKDERNPVKREEPSYQEDLDKEKTLPTLTSVKVEDSGLSEQTNTSNDMKNTTEHCPNKNINTPEQTNAGVGVIVSARSEQNSEGPKQTETTSHYGTLPHVGRLNYSEDKHSVNMFKDSASHNGDGDMSMETYPTHYVTPKTEFGHNMPSNHCQTGPYKYNRSEMAYNACMGSKNKGRAVPGSELGASAYQDYHQSLSNFASVSRKDVGVVEAMGRSGLGVGSRGQDSNLQLQQPYPSLLQEVLQGYHLDRRYSRPEQASGGLHNQNMSQHLYHTRLPYRMAEDMRSLGMSQSVVGGASVHQQIASKKPQTQNQGPDHEIGLGLSHPSWDCETQKHKGSHGGSSEKSTINMSPSHSTQIPPSVESSKGTPPKHINLADYSLPHRKPPNLVSPPSAVQQLLLQETGPLVGNAQLTSQTQSHVSSSSGRRSVICDVSPSRRTTPEKDRGQFAPSGSSVIQQSHSSSASSDQGCGKDTVKIKGEQEEEELSKVHPSDLARPSLDGHSVSDLHRHSAGKEVTEPPSNTSYNAHHMHANPLSSPPRSNPYYKPVEGSSSAGLSLYGFVDGSDRLKSSHNHFHPISSHISPSTNKLQAYPHHISLQHPHGMENRFDWSSNSNRPKDTPTPHSLDQKCKIQLPADALPSQHSLTRQHLHPGSHYEMKMWESFSEREGAGNHELQPAPTSHKAVDSQSVPTSAPKPVKVEVSQGIQEESTIKLNPAVVAGSGGIGNSSVTPGGPRQTKSGGSAETNPLILRRRVRSFISPIPAKRQHQDVSSQKSGSAYSPGNDPASGGADPRAKLASPNTAYQLPSANSPPPEKSKILPARKGRGLKLEAIVQKITPNKNASYTNSHGDADYPDVSHYRSDTPDSETRAPYSAEPNREESCLPYLEEAHSLDAILPYRAEDSYSCDSQDLKQSLRTGSTSNTVRKMPTDFDFGLGTAGSSGSGAAEGDKDEFTLLGPLPPPPPLPRPVQGSPPPSSSVLSDIQQFTNTYQQLETRRGEQSAANLLRQKLQETSMGFDDYPGGNFYGSTPIHGQSSGHHLLSRTPQHELASARTATDSKLSDNLVPKGYFPSGKKKGRPVGSVNKQKRAQGQAQTSTSNVPAAPHTPPAVGSDAVTPQPESNSSPGEEAVTTSALPEQKPSPSLDLAVQTQPAKVEMEFEDNQPEEDIKPVKTKQRKGKDANEGTDSKGQPWRKRRVVTPKDELDPQTGVLPESKKDVFSPYIHIENKITEIGAVCTIVNSEGEKSKGGGKNGSGVEGLSNVSLISQMVRKERETEKIQEAEQVDSVIQSGKSLPTSGYVLPGPVISDTRHTGRLLCCLCQKWANYKNLGDLYGPFYPADYAAKLPKNQPQIRQTSSNSGVANTGSNPSSSSTELTVPDTQSTSTPDVRSADCTASPTPNPVSPARSENLSCLSAQICSTTTTTPAQNWDTMPEGEPAPTVSELSDLTNEITQRKQQQVEDLQQRPQHRKLTSHPRFKRRHKSGEELPRTIPINSKASLPFQPPPPTLDSLGPLAQLAQLPVVPLDPSELWVHESCLVWTSGVYLVNGRLYGLQEALDGAREMSCSHCEMAGSTLGCYSKGCTLRYHYLCAMEAECCLNEDNFSMRCPKHKFPVNNRPAKPAATHLEQPDRS